MRRTATTKTTINLHVLSKTYAQVNVEMLMFRNEQKNSILTRSHMTSNLASNYIASTTVAAPAAVVAVHLDNYYSFECAAPK